MAKKSMNKLERQKNSRSRLGTSIYQTLNKIGPLETAIHEKYHIADYEKLQDLNYKLSLNLKEYMTVDALIVEEEQRLKKMYGRVDAFVRDAAILEGVAH